MPLAAVQVIYRRAAEHIHIIMHLIDIQSPDDLTIGVVHAMRDVVSRIKEFRTFRVFDNLLYIPL